MNISDELNDNKTNFLITIFIILIPIFFLVGSLVNNVAIILFDIFFLYTLIKKKDFNYLNNKYFYALILFWTYLLFNLFFVSINFEQSATRSIGFIRFVIFTFALSYFLNSKSHEIREQIFKSWTLIFLFISIDLIFEFIFGFNIFGYKSQFEGRLAGILNEELKIGHFYFTFILISLVTIQQKFKSSLNNQIIFYTSVFLFLTISFLIGERSNFIKTLTMIFLFIFFIERGFLLKKILVSIFFLILASIITFNNPSFKDRFWGKLVKPLLNNPVELISNSKYSSHYKVAIQVFENNKIFGVGLKNYRLEVLKDKYDLDASVHPHQTHFEILSELGLTGYILFLSVFIYILYHSFKSYLRDKSNIKISGLLFITISLLPILPSGSFFTTFGASLFWLNFSLLFLKKN